MNINLNFSLLISVYRKENPVFFKQSLQSIINQSVKPNQIVIVKDGNLTPDLDELLEQFTEINKDIVKIVPLKTNVGLGRALNIGLKHCIYPLVARMDSDDISKYNRFEKELDIFINNPSIDVVGSWVDEFISDKDFKVNSIKKLPETSESLIQYAKKRNPINHPSVMFRKHAVDAVGGYMDFPLFEDYFLWIRMMVNKSNFYNIQESLLLFRISLDVYKRRGGFRYAIIENRLRNEMLRLRFISYYDYIIECPIRFMSRIIPAFLRAKLYKFFLR